MDIRTYLQTVETVADRFEYQSPITIRADFAVKIKHKAAQCSLPPAITFDDYKAHSLNDLPSAPINIRTMRALVFDPHTELSSQFEIDEWPIDQHGAALLGESLKVTPESELHNNRAAVARMLREYVKYYTPRLPLDAPPDVTSRARRAVELLQTLQGCFVNLTNVLCKKCDAEVEYDPSAEMRAAATMYLRYRPQVNACTQGGELLGPLFAQDTLQDPIAETEVSAATMNSLNFTNSTVFSYSVRSPNSAELGGTCLLQGRCAGITALTDALERDPYRIDIASLDTPAKAPTETDAETDAVAHCGEEVAGNDSLPLTAMQQKVLKILDKCGDWMGMSQINKQLPGYSQRKMRDVFRDKNHREAVLETDGRRWKLRPKH